MSATVLSSDTKHLEDCNTGTKFSLNMLAWTDTDDTEGTKESGESSDQTKDTTTPGELQKGSLISVREADEANRSDEAEDEINQMELNGVHEAPLTTDTEVPQTTDTEGVNGTETDSLGSMESGARRRVKRNAVLPTDGEDSGRQTPDVESRKGTVYSQKLMLISYCFNNGLFQKKSTPPPSPTDGILEILAGGGVQRPWKSRQEGGLN